jgi:hypothetical protein
MSDEESRIHLLGAVPLVTIKMNYIFIKGVLRISERFWTRFASKS